MDRRQIVARQLLIQRLCSARLAAANQRQAFIVARGLECLAVVPQFELRRDPVAGLAQVAGQAGVWRTEPGGALGVGNAEAVVMTKVIAHVELAGHMAIDAKRPGLPGDMARVLRCFVVLGLQAAAIDRGNSSLARRVVALQAHAIAGGLQLVAMGVVAVGATYAFVGHLALGEGAVLKHLILDLAVQGIQFAGEGAGQIVVHQALAHGIAVTQRRATGVAAGAGFEFDRGVLALQVHRKAGMQQVAFFCRPLHMVGRRAMASLAADAEAVPLAVEGVAGRIEIALIAGGVAFHAHEIGVLVWFAPVQWVLEVHALAGIEVEPAVFLGIPGHTQGLQATVADFDQILLQGRDAEGVGNLEVGSLALDARRVDPELIAPAKEPGGLAFVLERCIIEIGRHGGRCRLLHRQLMVRTLPVLGLGLMATLALLLVDHLRRWHRHRFGRYCHRCRRR